MATPLLWVERLLMTAYKIPRKIIFALTVLLPICGSISGLPPARGGEPAKSTIALIIDGIKVTVEVARTEGEKEKGLMFREKLPPDTGMLFIYEQEDFLSFWMKNTRFPLSIAFIDRHGRIVDIQDMEPFSLSGHISRAPAQFALEMNRGWFHRKGIKVGDTVKIPAFSPREAPK